MLHSRPVLASHVQHGAFQGRWLAAAGSQRIGNDAGDHQRLAHRRELHGKRQLPGRRTASRDFSSQSTVCAGFSGISEMSGVDRDGLDAGGLSSEIQPCSTLRDTTATGVRPLGRRRPSAKHN